MKNLKRIDLEEFVNALHGKRVALIGEIKVPDGKPECFLKALDEKVGELDGNRRYGASQTFQGMCGGYKRGNTRHNWQVGDECYRYKTFYVRVTVQGHVIGLLQDVQYINGYLEVE